MFPGHAYGMELVNPDLATLGNAYGALGLRVGHDEEFLPAFKQAMAAGRSALIEVLTDHEYATPTATLSELSGKTLQGE
jgi:acetolactate synthase-1/2/3 large subunit